MNKVSHHIGKKIEVYMQKLRLPMGFFEHRATKESSQEVVQNVRLTITLRVVGTIMPVSFSIVESTPSKNESTIDVDHKKKPTPFCTHNSVIPLLERGNLLFWKS